MKELTIANVGVAAVGKLFGLWFAIVGFVFGGIGAITSAISVVINNDNSVWADVGIVAGSLAVCFIVIPLLWYALGWIQGAVFALIFDVVNRHSGGVTLVVEEKSIRK